MKILFFLLFFISPILHATSLLQAVNAARHHDAEFSAAFQAKKAGNEAFDQGVAGLLPTISLDGSYTQQDQPHASYAAAVKRHSYSVTLNQPLFDISKIAAFQRGNAASELADMEFIAAQQKLIRDVADAYFAVIYQREVTEVAISATKVFQKQRAQAVTAFRLGNGNRTEVDEAQANYDEAEAQEIMARNDLEVANAAYQRMTGLDADEIIPVSTQCYQPSQLGDIKKVLLQAQSNNTEIKKATQQVELSKSDLVGAAGAHLPIVTLQGAYGGNWSRGENENVLDSVFGTTSKTRNTLVGVNVSIPLFAGGGQLSATREAIDRRNQVRDLLEHTRRKVGQETRTAWLNITNGMALLKARKKAAMSAETKVKSTSYGRELGLRTIIDELNAEQKYYDSLQSIAEARYKYLTSTFDLLLLLGTLDDRILIAFDCKHPG
ncbi:TolC family outer membrane protein [Erwinia sorbitola]|uniref:TolC family outer membrane protein n=1 Tax=Erwinia sorbitola TaxID=2681984 RepID=A0A6I6F6I9_9GAMM|nr:TolC family outer membrane protein [Erwinia sorbitola]MTD28843.1 TolC family outer membrane protein [Erwinia sorbitola]QGU89500.1 TolC family outer membrane protein [Erwinia sorbitola]